MKEDEQMAENDEKVKELHPKKASKSTKSRSEKKGSNPMVIPILKKSLIKLEDQSTQDMTNTTT